jgi:hypothetical protein
VSVGLGDYSYFSIIGEVEDDGLGLAALTKSFLPKSLNEDGREGSEDYFSKLERDLLRAFEE